MEVDYTLVMLGNVFLNAYSWFLQIFVRAGALNYLLGAIFTVLVYRFLLAPLLDGSGGSDQAKKSGRKGK